jgi:hypothetical protein
VKAYKLELLVIDFENYGEEELKMLAMNARGLDPTVISIEGRDIGEWTDDHPLNNRRTAKAEFKRLFTPSSATTAGGERQNQADESNVLPPFAAPASQRDAGTTVLTMDQVAEIMRACNVNYSPVMAAFARTLEAEVVSRCRAQGGNTIIDHDINGKPVYLATPANTAPAVQPEMAKHLQARTWQPITKPGQVKVGDKLRFTIGDDKFSETAKVILHAGTDREEIIYNKRRNYYLITSLSIKNSGSSKNVEFLPQGQNSASNGATGEKA